MICANCGTEAATKPCPACGGDPDLGGRYQLEAVLGEGASGATYLGRRLEDGRAVAIKERVYARQPDLQRWELFEREWRVLREIRHPRIPAYVDHLQQGEGRRFALYVVTELVEGKTLREELEERRYTGREAVDAAVEVLEILEHLHALSPPVVHRDIKPANLMRAADGHLSLIDFGSVRATLEPSETPTVAGTFGFMAPEQMAGDATPASDLYAVGALLVALLTRQDPAALYDGTRVVWRDRASVSDELAGVIDDLLARVPSRRPPSARAAIARLRDTPEARGEPAGRALVPVLAAGRALEPSHRAYADRLVDTLIERRIFGDDARREIGSLMIDETVPPDRRRDVMHYALDRYAFVRAPATRAATSMAALGATGVGAAMIGLTWLFGSFAAMSVALYIGGGLSILGVLVFVLVSLGVLKLGPDEEP